MKMKKGLLYFGCDLRCRAHMALRLARLLTMRV